MRLYKITFIPFILFMLVSLTSSAAYSGAAAGGAALLARQAGVSDNYEKFTADKLTLDEGKTILSGEWGDLELTPVIVQPSEDFIATQTDFDELINLFNSSSRWTFRGMSLDQIRAMFHQAGLAEEVCDLLMQHTHESDDGNGFVTVPHDAILWSLTPEIKAKLYPLIGKYGDNIMYGQPLCFNSGDKNEWIYKSSLSKSLAEKLLQLVYTENGICYISDIHLILPFLETAEDWNGLLRTIYRTRACDLSLVIREGQNVDEITDYWGNLGRQAYVRTIFEQASDTPGGSGVDISAVLPEIPRERINTYSGIAEYLNDWKDCHWTTINFFNSAPDERYYGLADFASFFGKISRPLDSSPLKFGDIIAVYDESGELMHTCIYIAGNVVLTKNGAGSLKPFIFSSLDKTVSLYGNRVEYLIRTVADTYTVAVQE